MEQCVFVCTGLRNSVLFFYLIEISGTVFVEYCGVHSILNYEQIKILIINRIVWHDI